VANNRKSRYFEQMVTEFPLRSDDRIDTDRRQLYDQLPNFPDLYIADSADSACRSFAMDSFLARLNTPSARLVLVALASSSLTALSIYSFQSLRREHALSSLKAEATSIKPTQIHRLNSIGAEDMSGGGGGSKETQIARQAKRGEYDEELVMEQLARNRVFFGDEGMDRIRNGFVIVVGAGGVGSWAATMLARSGIGISLYILYSGPCFL
jgi:hypothetical protein